jgi:hypothetical protein
MHEREWITELICVRATQAIWSSLGCGMYALVATRGLREAGIAKRNAR